MSNVSSVTLEEANTAIAAAIARSTELGFNMAIAVVDVQTSLVALARMDGTNPFTPDVVRGKAMVTAVTRGTPSGVAAERFPKGLQETVSSLYGGRITWVQGAVPLKRNGEFIGAIAAGGGPPEVDEQVAQAGADALA
jgi:glc operon protein GlcG